LSINGSHTTIKYWQEGFPQKTQLRGVLYLGTGFQFCPVDSAGRALYGANFLMPVGDGTIEQKLEKNIREVLRRKGKNGSLRIRDICSGSGIENIHEALSGERKTGEEIGSTNPRETYETFSKILGNVVRQIFATGSYRGGLFIGGTLAAKLEPYLDSELVLKGYRANDSGFVERIKSDVPIGIITDQAATHRGIVYAIKEGIESTYTGVLNS